MSAPAYLTVFALLFAVKTHARGNDIKEQDSGGTAGISPNFS